VTDRDWNASSGSRLTALAEQAAKLTALFAVLGYISIRAHFNYLGVSFTRPLGLERYLVETYLFAAAVAYKLLWIALIGALAAAPVLLLRRTNRAARSAVQRIETGHRSSAFQAGSLTVLAAGSLWLITTLGQQDVLVGALSESIVSHRRPWRFDLALVLVVAGLLSRRLAQTRETAGEESRQSVPAILVGLQLVPLAALATLVPVLYGEAAHPTEFPFVQVQLKDTNAPTCGLLMLNTTSEITIWQAAHGRGRLTVLPSSRIAATAMGRLDDALSLAVTAAKTPNVVIPPCEVDAGG
jgi:hypothetical protein